ncbi:hypothetical protein GOODEAATRI_000246 [Goodea atripinnis]|uniref:Zinc finger CCCH-type containing 12A n=1 Tax=Goodea atripinnis TaxID=208336 RepID=A0ABV0P074_9TELE
MKADVGLLPATQPWSRTTTAHLDVCGWGPCEKMLEPTPDPQLLEAQLNFFHKLGFSTAQVQAVQRKFGTDTDKVLGELVRIGAGREDKQEPVTTVSVLVPRRDSKARAPELLVPVTDSSSLSREDNGEDGDALRAVVIDGSNVAMRLLVRMFSEEEAELSPVLKDRLRFPLNLREDRLTSRRPSGDFLSQLNHSFSIRVSDNATVRECSHGNKEVFSCLGIQLAVNFFLDRGHSDVTVFVPSWRKEQPRPDVPITADQHILRELEKKKILVFTPSRRVAGKRVVCNDDCFIVKHAFESNGVVVSNDMYRDLQGEKPEWKRFIEERLLMYSFVNNK